MPAGAKEPVVVHYLEHVPADVGAAFIWLKNRDPEHWRDVQNVEHVLGKYIISDHPMTVEQWAGTASKCAVITVALTSLAQPAQARTQLNCVTTSVIITEKAGRDTSVQVEQHMSFWIDDVAKTLEFSDGRLLRVTLFDKKWISANTEDTQYEFNRGEGLLTYAGSKTQGNATTTIVGSGRCEEASTPKT
jgi:hypothetical protein